MTMAGVVGEEFVNRGYTDALSLTFEIMRVLDSLIKNGWTLFTICVCDRFWPNIPSLRGVEYRVTVKFVRRPTLTTNQNHIVDWQQPVIMFRDGCEVKDAVVPDEINEIIQKTLNKFLKEFFLVYKPFFDLSSLPPVQPCPFFATKPEWELVGGAEYPISEYFKRQG